MHWTLKLCVPIASAAVLAGCTQEVETNPDRNRTPIAGASSGPAQTLALTGCLSTGPGTNQYVLTHVQPARPDDAQATRTIERNSAVRLASNESHDLTSLVGETISVTGILEDDGRNTIGTAGDTQPAPGSTQPRTDASQAASNQHHSEKVREEAGPIGNRSMNNGSYPEITVQSVERTGTKCVTAAGSPH
jgi:hypothetical protein